MFTGELAVKFLSVVQLIVAPTQGLMRLFPLREDGVFNAIKVEYDIVQVSEGMALPRKRGGGTNIITSSKYQNVTEEPPYISEGSIINVHDLAARVAGVNKYDDVNMSKTRKLMNALAFKFSIVQSYIDRQIEWQAAEILQRGQLDYSQFTGKVPAPLDVITFDVDPLMFPTTALTWDTATGKQMRDDILAQCDLVRIRGKATPTDIILGRASNDRFFEAAGNLTLLDNRRTEIGMRAPEALRADGFALQGEMTIGPYKLRFWLYQGFFTHPVTGVETQYIDTNSSIVFAANGERARYHAAVDIVIPTDAEVAQLLPGIAMPDRIVTQQAAEFMPWAFTDDNNKTTKIGIDSAPLLVPVNRGASSRLDTLAT